jgi:hypothetical protein
MRNKCLVSHLFWRGKHIFLDVVHGGIWLSEANWTENILLFTFFRFFGGEMVKGMISLLRTNPGRLTVHFSEGDKK